MIMTENDPAGAPPKPANERGILCAKCEHLNPGDTNVCSYCGAHLFVTCHHCGHRNQRAYSRCAHCRRRLHRSLIRKWYKWMFRGQAKAKPLHFVLMIIVVFIAYKIIVHLAEYQPPSVP